MTDAKMLERLDKAAFVSAQPEDLTPLQLAQLALMPTDQVAGLSIDPDDFEPYART